MPDAPRLAVSELNATRFGRGQDSRTETLLDGDVGRGCCCGIKEGGTTRHVVSNPDFT